VLLLLVLAVISTAAAIAASATHRSSTPTPAATAPPRSVGTGPAPTTTTTTETVPAVPSTSTPAAAPPPAAAPAPAPLAWPSGRSGYTVVLASISSSTGRGAALARAREARRAGLPRVGVLLSSGYASLRPGYWVVFSGVYDSRASAQAGLPDARARGFPDAYPARVAR
jgi:hypothetical protein